MKQNKETQSDRLSALLGEMDPQLIDEALKTDTPEALASLTKKRVPLRPSSSAHPGARRRPALIASVAVLLVLAMVLPVALHLSGGWGPDPWESTPSDDYVDPSSVIPPWRSGELKLSSLTYRIEENATALLKDEFFYTPSPTVDLLTEWETDGPTEGDTNGGTDGATDTEQGPAADQEAENYGEGENFSVSIMDNTKITSYMGEHLIKLRPESGEHVDCPDVYFDITTNEYTCMSCRVLDMMAGSEDYTDAAIRCFMAECVLTYVGIEYSHLVDEYTALLQEPLTKAIFERREGLTARKLGIKSFLTDEHEAYLKESIPAFEYPVVDIAEYGSDMGKCLFTLISPRTSVAYGNFVCDLESGDITRIDKNCTGYEIPSLAAAQDIRILDGYSVIIAAVPDFALWLSPVLHTDLLQPVYAAHNVCVFRVETGECERLITSEKAGNVPNSSFTESLGVLTYVGKDGLIYAYDQTHFYALEGALSRVIGDTEGGRYAVMKQEDDYVLYRLENGEAVPTPVSEIAEWLDVGNRYVLEGNVRLDLGSGETLTLWEGEAVATAASKDGRYLYLYFAGTEEILCLDAWSGERGYLSLSDRFTAAALAAGEISYHLMLNAEENRLLMTYYKEGLVVFDAEAFREGVGIAGGSIDKALDAVVDYYTINGAPLRFYETVQAENLLRVLSVTPYLDSLVAGTTSRENNLTISIGAAEALIPYLEVWAHTARVPDGVVESMLGDMAPAMFREYFQFTMKQYTQRFKPVEMDNGYGLRRDTALKKLASEFAENYGVLFGVTMSAEELALWSERALGVLDPIVDEERRVSDHDLSLAYRSLLVEISSALTGKTYAEFVQSGDFLKDTKSVYFVTTDSTAGDIRSGVHLPCDEAFVREFLASLTFVEGEREIKAEGRLSRRVFMDHYMDFSQSILEVGYAEDGKAYVVIDGYYAEITPEALERFKGECVNRDSTIVHYPDIY